MESGIAANKEAFLRDIGICKAPYNSFPDIVRSSVGFKAKREPLCSILRIFFFDDCPLAILTFLKHFRRIINDIRTTKKEKYL